MITLFGTTRIEEPATGLPGLEALAMFLAGLAATQVHPLGALAVLASLGPALVWRHRKDPATVAGLVIALFCFSPFLRRVADYRFGYTPSSQVLASPYAAVGMVALLVLLSAPLLRREHLIPSMFSLAAVVYAYCLGILNTGVFPATIGLLQFASGPLVLLHIAAHRERFSLRRMEAWIGAVGLTTAAYGIYQYAVFPPWEELWLVASRLTGPAGQPEPFGIRTWSTLNSMAPFSYFMAFVLIVLVRSKWLPLVGPVCALALISTMARSAWATTLLGWGFCFLLLAGKDRMRLMTMLAGLVACLGVSALFMPTESLDRLSTRLETFRNLEKDDSYSTRLNIASSAGHLDGIQDPMGIGFGSIGTAARVGEGGGMAHFDNGFIALAMTFGWVGSFVYFSGFFGSLVYALSRRKHLPATAILFICAASALFFANVFENTMSDFRGVLVWVAVGAAIAAIETEDSGVRAS